MNENINLCEILKGCEGIELYSPIIGDVVLVKIHDSSCNQPIEVMSEIGNFYFSKCGKYFYKDIGECILFPSKDQRDWSKFEKCIKEGTPMMCRNKSTLSWILCYYERKYNNRHYVKYIYNTNSSWEEDFNYMIPFDKFNPNDVKESLKYNIQK